MSDDPCRQAIEVRERICETQGVLAILTLAVTALEAEQKLLDGMEAALVSVSEVLGLADAQIASLVEQQARQQAARAAR